MIKRDHPNATVCLWANNQLFRTYSDIEKRRIADATDLFICCSQFIANDIDSQCPQMRGKTRVVRNGVNTDRFRPRMESKQDEFPTILFVGRIVPEKGPDLLLRAACLLRDRGHGFRVSIVGSSNFDAAVPLSRYEKDLRRLAAPLGEAASFQHFVDREHIVEVYHRASIFCVPSNWDDPCPLTVPEAMACGLPVVASRRGGIPEQGEDAILYFSPPEVGQLAEHLASLILNPGLRQKWGVKARDRAMALSWHSQYQKLCDCLK
jgi:glycosyltransferase involved in cell wall biosynthesis